MTEEIQPTEGAPEGETTPEPIVQPEPLKTVAHIKFEDPAGIVDAGPYAASITRPDGMSDTDYAKAIAETVERTVLLQLGALPILQKVEEGA